MPARRPHLSLLQPLRVHTCTTPVVTMSMQPINHLIVWHMDIPCFVSDEAIAAVLHGLNCELSDQWPPEVDAQGVSSFKQGSWLMVREPGMPLQHAQCCLTCQSDVADRALLSEAGAFRPGSAAVEDGTELQDLASPNQPKGAVKRSLLPLSAQSLPAMRLAQNEVSALGVGTSQECSSVWCCMAPRRAANVVCRSIIQL